MDKKFMVTAFINGRRKIYFFVTIDIDNPPKNMDGFIREKAEEYMADVYTPINTINYSLQQII